MNTSPILPLTETIAPADEAAVAEAVRRAGGNGGAVYPLGGGTTLAYGVRPSRPGLGLSLAKLSRVIDYPADDMTITVEAGITVAELSTHLAAKRQRLPIDFPHAEQATIGGAVATNLNGPRRYACGTLCDYVIGIRAVDGRGTAFAGGGRVVKNAAGYNMCRLLVGSLGTLGVVTQVTLMVRPLPETSVLVACDVHSLNEAEELLSALVHSQTAPAAIELLTGRAHEISGGLSQFSFDENGTVPLGSQEDCPVLGPIAADAARLLVGFEGSAAEVAWMVGRLCDEWRKLGMASPMIVDAADSGRLWHWLTELRADVQICVSPSALVALVGSLRGLDSVASIQSHAGNGVIRLRVADEGRGARDEGISSPLPLGEGQGEGVASRAPNGEETAAHFARMVREQLRPLAAGAGAKMVVLSSPDGAELTRDDVWGPPGEGAAVMRAIKERFDPQGVLNPGRYIF